MKVSGIVVVVLTSLAPLGAQQFDSFDRETAVRLFSQRIAAYAALHRRLETPLLTLTPSRDMMKNYVARQLLAGRIRKARTRAAQGDIFTPGVAMVFRTMVAHALKERDIEALLVDLQREQPDIDANQLLVNEPLPDGATHEVPALLLQVLPPLPEDVEYRIVDHDLALWDIHADLVVDFLPDALRPLETTLVR
jgi:hypothetical protein